MQNVQMMGSEPTMNRHKTYSFGSCRWAGWSNGVFERASSDSVVQCLFGNMGVNKPGLWAGVVPTVFATEGTAG